MPVPSSLPNPARHASAPPVAELEDERARILVNELCQQLENYLTPEQIREVYRAYLFSAAAHAGQQRRSGEPYIHHPLAVARILANMRMDHKCLMAAILHDVIEDTATAKERLAEIFDDEIAELVDGVSKLTQVDFKTRAEAQAANFRKMLLAMTRDIRVILIKLADRLHNMRTLGVMSPAKRRRISRETLEIYAPIANRLGIDNIRLELEELGFSHYWPWRHFVLKNALCAIRQQHREPLAQVENAIRQRLAREGIRAEVYGREKHLYSIYSKMLKKGQSFRELADVFAFRVIVDSVDTCYRVLGQVHNLYKPVPGRFKDYIAIPKANGYQSLHTVLFGPHGVPIEIQIRTLEMHRAAEAGIAAHWLYKSNSEEGNAHFAANSWLRSLVEMQRNSGDSQEFLEHVKIDLFPDEVYVFTPKGEIMVLPKGATVVDFAYAIHSDVGNACVAARIDRRLAPLRTVLHSGQTVEIINAPGATPNAAWLNFVVTGKARANIRAYLKNMQQREAEAFGRRLINAELAAFGVSLDTLPPTRLAAYLTANGLSSSEQLFVEVGLGQRLPVLVARHLVAESLDRVQTLPLETERPALSTPLAIVGTEGTVVQLAHCCRPIPGDPIVALLSPGQGIIVHRAECTQMGSYRSQQRAWLDVGWAAEPQGEFPTAIRVEVGDRRGVLASIAAAIAEQGANIETVRSNDKDGINKTLDFLVNVRDRNHLARILLRLRKITHVVRIARVMG